MSTLRIEDVQNLSGLSSFNLNKLNKLLPTAWAKIHCVSSSAIPNRIYDGFNFSDCERTTTGNYQMTFATPMDTTTYTVVAYGRRTSGTGLVVCYLARVDVVANDVDGFRMRSASAANSVGDIEDMYIVVYGGKS